MARKPRPNRVRPVEAPMGGTSVLDEAPEAPVRTAPRAAAAPQPTPRQRARAAANAAAGPADYTYVTHDVIRITIVTVLIITVMVGLSFIIK